eukprot:c34389_g1_i1 orf=1-471(-)
MVADDMDANDCAEPTLRLRQYAPKSQHKEPRGGAVTASAGEQLDVEAYASLYTGRTKIMRLFFIADHCQNLTMELEALRMSYDEIKKGENTILYKEVCEKTNGRLGPVYTFDQEWVDTVDRRAAQRLEKLENELNGYKTNLIKESIRMGNNDFGDFF